MRERPITVTIFGILNICFALFGFLSSLLGGSLESMGAESSNSNLNSIVALISKIDTHPANVLWTRISGPLDFAGNLALLAAGVGLLLLKNWGRTVSMAFAIYKLASTIVYLIVLSMVLHAVLHEAVQNLATWVVPAIITVGLFATVITAAYPVMLLYFMRRPRVAQACQQPPPPPAA